MAEKKKNNYKEESEFEDLKIAEKTIYKRLKRLKDIGVIKDETNRQTVDGKAKEVC